MCREENWFSAVCDVRVSHPCPPGSSGQWTEFDRAIKRYADKKRKENFPHIYGNSDWSVCKVTYDEGLPNI
jgi:hypothetical protein